MNLTLKDSINVHRQNHDWEEVVELSGRLLEEEPGDVGVLRALAEAYENLAREKELVRTWQTLVDRHHENLPYGARLGLHLKKSGSEKARRYLQLALQTAIDRKSLEDVEELWLELAELKGVPSSVFIQAGQRLALRRERELAGELMTLYLDSVQLDPGQRLQILRLIVDYLPDRHAHFRQVLIDAYREAYADRPDVEKLIGVSNIAISDSLQEAMVDLDRLLKFGEGQYFHHDGWGTGKVQRIEPTQKRVFIDFEKKSNHSLTLEMADKSLTPVSREDLRALVFDHPEKVSEMADSEPAELVKAALIARGGDATGKELKETLVNRAIPESKWQRWWTAVNKKLREDPYVEVAGASHKTYTLRDEPEGPHEEYPRRFRETKTLSGKLELLKQYLDQLGENADPDAVKKMIGDLLSKASTSKADHQIVEAGLLIEDLSERMEVEIGQTSKLFEPIRRDINRSVNALEGLRSAELQRRWFAMMEETLGEELSGAYEKLMLDGPDSIRDLVAEHVKKTHEEDVLNQLFKKYRQAAREHPGLFIWCARHLLGNADNARTEGTSRPALVEQLIEVHEILSYQAKTSRKEQSASLRAHMSAIRQILKRSNMKFLREVMKETDATTARALWTAVEGAPGLEDRIRKEISGYVMSHFPEATKAIQGSTLETSAPRKPLPERLLCLPESLERKKEELKRLREVEIPENTREIETARQHGDLRENAEYHAAKEKQGVLQALTAKLQEELSNALAVVEDHFDKETVGFGVKVRFLQDGEETEKMILGPWESDPEAGILSYLSPLGQAVWGRVPGSMFAFETGGRLVPIEVLEIETLDEAPTGALHAGEPG